MPSPSPACPGEGVFALTCPSQEDVEGLFHRGINCSPSLVSPDNCNNAPPVTGHQGFLLLLGSGTALSDRTSVMLEMF